MEDTARIRIEKIGGGAAHLDAAWINQIPPIKAKGAPLFKLKSLDYDVTDAGPAPIELEFDLRGTQGKPLELLLAGRIESEQISPVPFQFPRANTFRRITPSSRFYEYRWGSSPGKLTLDGNLAPEKLESPFFAEYIPVGSGHPQGRTFGWVRNDASHLYVAIDFTSDNTRDGEKDYAKVYVNTGGRIQEFKISESLRKWGVVGFSRTAQAPYEHKVYEFRIPRDKIVPAGKSKKAAPLMLAFAAYGTSAPLGDMTPHLSFNSTDQEYLLVYAHNAGGNPGIIDIVGQRLAFDGTPLAPFFTIASNASPGIANTYFRAAPKAAYDPANNRYLVVWDDDDPADPIQDYQVYGRLVNADESLVGANKFIISAAPGQQVLPDVAYDSTNARFLVTWEDLFHSQLASMNTGTGAATKLGGVEFTFVQGLAYDPNNSILYGVANHFTTEVLFTIDPATGGGTLIGPTGLTGVGSLAYDSTNNILYGVRQGTHSLVSFNVSTGAGTVVGPVTVATNVAGLAYDPGGDMLYAADPGTDSLYTLDRATGAGTLIGSSGSFGASTSIVGLSFHSGVLYGIDNASPGNLVIINTTNGTISPVGNNGTDFIQALASNGTSLLSIDNVPDSEIAGQVINSAGAAVGSKIDIATAANDQLGVSAAFNPSNNRYLVVWEDGRDLASTGRNIYGQFINTDGTLQGSNQVISSLALDQTAPNVAYESWLDRYLVTWGDATDGNIHRELLDASGATQVADAPASGSNAEALPAAAYNTGTGTFLVAWETSFGADDDIEGGEVNPSTGATAGLGVIANAPSTFQVEPAVAAHPACQNFLVAYQTSAGSRYGTGQAVATAIAGNCIGPYLDWVGAPGGVSPSTGPAGTTFTFEINYFSPSNAAPTATELWIDLNHDGVYSAGALGAQPPSGWSGEFSPQLSMLTALFMAGLLLLAFRRRQPSRYAALGIMMVALVLLPFAGCGSSGDGGGGGAADSGAVSERFTMTETNALDLNYLDGKTYTVDRAIGAAGTYNYKFIFKDGNVTAVGIPASASALVVN